ncbi:MAG: flagellar biosynthetic protein FliO, partial [Nitrospinaceae bacterium]|nr:flagellar biosynthetic protein FliO [Nitrospinaceae bacterium]
FGLVPTQSSHLNVIETRLLGSKHTLHVVEYGSKRFLIADSPVGTNYLTDLEKLNDSPQESSEAVGKFSPGSFAGKLKTLLERKG